MYFTQIHYIFMCSIYVLFTFPPAVYSQGLLTQIVKENSRQCPVYVHSNMAHACSVEKGRGEGTSKEEGISALQTHWGHRREALSSFSPEGIFQERLLKSLFCLQNSEQDKGELFPLKDCLMFKPQANLYFKCLLSFSYEFNLPFNLFRGFDHAAKWNLNFCLVNIRARNSSFKFLTMCPSPPLVLILLYLYNL